MEGEYIIIEYLIYQTPFRRVLYVNDIHKNKHYAMYYVYTLVLLN